MENSQCTLYIIHEYILNFISLLTSQSVQWHYRWRNDQPMKFKIDQANLETAPPTFSAPWPWWGNLLLTCIWDEEKQANFIFRLIFLLTCFCMFTTILLEVRTCIYKSLITQCVSHMHNTKQISIHIVFIQLRLLRRHQTER